MNSWNSICIYDKVYLKGDGSSSGSADQKSRALDGEMWASEYSTGGKSASE